MTNCRNCHQRIAFVKNTKTGHAMPVDPFPDTDGNVFAIARGGVLVGHVQKKGQTCPTGWTTYMSHFATCPNHKPQKRHKRPKTTAVPSHPTETTAGAGQRGTEGTP